MDTSRLRMNDAGCAIIKRAEGLRLEAYESSGKSYIGYGHQRRFGDLTRITEAEAESLLRIDVRSTEDGVRRLLTRPANENQFSAMVSLAYNIGLGNFANSPVLARLGEGDVSGAAEAFRSNALPARSFRPPFSGAAAGAQR